MVPRRGDGFGETALHPPSYHNDVAYSFVDMDCEYDPEIAQDFMFAARAKTPTKLMKKRAGAKAVKAFERAADAQGLSNLKMPRLSGRFQHVEIT